MAKDDFLLYVEDDSNDAELTMIAFKEIKFSHGIVVVNDGAKALDFLFAKGEFSGRDKGETPALVLLDLNLPKVHGLEVLKKMKADRLLKHVLVVILTSSNEERDRTRAAELGTNLYIQKPVDFNDFSVVVQKIKSLFSALKT